MENIIACPLKGNLFLDEDLKTLNNNKFNSETYKDLLKQMRENIKPTDRAWLAGIIDGEGYIGFRAKEKKQCGNRSLTPIIEVESCTPIMQYKLKELTKSGVFRNRKRSRSTSIRYAKTLEVAALLELILPYLIVKKQMAIFVREFCLRRLNKVAICEYDHILYKKVKELNKKFKK